VTTTAEINGGGAGRTVIFNQGIKENNFASLTQIIFRQNTGKSSAKFKPNSYKSKTSRKKQPVLPATHLPPKKNLNIMVKQTCLQLTKRACFAATALA
jgi:hypothetical protein